MCTKGIHSQVLIDKLDQPLISAHSANNILNHQQLQALKFHGNGHFWYAVYPDSEIMELKNHLPIKIHFIMFFPYFNSQEMELFLWLALQWSMKLQHCFALPNCHVVSREEGGKYSGFQVTGMIKGFFWVWNFRFLDFFWVWKFGKYFLGSLIWVEIFFGY